MNMDDRYQPNGTPLTAHEREVLVILMEEAAEVIQAASKLIRFGKENRPDTGVSNVNTLSIEIGELLLLVSMANNLGLAREDYAAMASIPKRKRLKQFMQTDGASDDDTRDGAG